MPAVQMGVQAAIVRSRRGPLCCQGWLQCCPLPYDSWHSLGELTVQISACFQILIQLSQGMPSMLMKRELLLLHQLE